MKKKNILEVLELYESFSLYGKNIETNKNISTSNGYTSGFRAVPVNWIPCSTGDEILIRRKINTGKGYMAHRYLKADGDIIAATVPEASYSNELRLTVPNNVVSFSFVDEENDPNNLYFIYIRRV